MHPTTLRSPVEPMISHYADRVRNIAFPSVNKMDKCTKESQTEFQGNLRMYDGKVYEHGDRSDIATLRVPDSIDRVAEQCVKTTKPSLVKKLVGSIPLPFFLPVMKKKIDTLLKLDKVELGVCMTTSGRQSYGEVTGIAFKTVEQLSSLSRQSMADSAWSPRFQLFETPSPEKTWHILGYTEDAFMSWWRKRRAESGSNAGWADMKALCKSVVYIYDDVYSEPKTDISEYKRLMRLMAQAQRASVMLVRLLFLRPGYAKATSTLFGFTVPLIFALSRIAIKAKELQDYDQLEPLLQATVDLLLEFGTRVRCKPYMVLVKEGMKSLNCTYIKKLEDVLLGTSLEKDKESLRTIVARIQDAEIANIGHKIIEASLDEEDPTYDLTFLQSIGLERIAISDVPCGILGHGTSSIVSKHSRLSDVSTFVVVKHRKRYGERAFWNNIRREALIWINLKHENVLPLLGYCMLSAESTDELIPEQPSTSSSSSLQSFCESVLRSNPASSFSVSFLSSSIFFPKHLGSHGISLHALEPNLLSLIPSRLFQSSAMVKARRIVTCASAMSSFMYFNVGFE
ncbi:hypothetical protein ACEPAF_117 [Sanghuangporus sanghuang]